MSRFEDAVVRRKRAERKRRQEVLREQIAGYRMGSFTIGEAYRLFEFFSLADPSDEDLMEATGIVTRHIKDIAAFWRKFHAAIPPKE